MVGKGVLLECLDHPEIEEVLSIGRKAIELEHPKLVQKIHKDFSEFDSIKDELAGYDAAYMCMGVSAAGMSEADYRRMTYDFAMALAGTLYALNPDMTLTYVSGVGTDSTEKGRTMWARVKGKTENDLLQLGFKQAFMFRPGGILPTRGVQPSSNLYRFMVRYFTWLLHLFKMLAPKSIVNSSQIGWAMIHVSKSGFGKKILEPRDILEAAENPKV